MHSFPQFTVEIHSSGGLSITLPDGTDVVSWTSDEWQEEPENVVPAMLNAIQLAYTDRERLLEIQDDHIATQEGDYTHVAEASIKASPLTEPQPDWYYDSEDDRFYRILGLLRGAPDSGWFVVTLGTGAGQFVKQVRIHDSDYHRVAWDEDLTAAEIDENPHIDPDSLR